MKNRLRRRIRILCRHAFLALLMLCLIVQPVFAGRAALHETVDHSCAAAHAAQDGTPDGAPDGTRPQPDPVDLHCDADVSHALMHHAHCCAQPQLPTSAHWRLPAPMPPAGMPLARGDAVFDDAQTATPFRPPIRA